MLVERFPEPQALQPEQQLELASELAKVALRAQTAPDLSSKAIELMEEPKVTPKKQEPDQKRNARHRK